MTIDLSTVTFESDFFSVPLPDGSTLVINRINEDFEYEGDETAIDAYNIMVQTESENILCSSVIGSTNDYFTLSTKYEEYYGKLMTSESFALCYLEIPEDE